MSEPKIKGYDIWKQSIEGHLDWCERCSRWHHSNALTLCKLEDAMDTLTREKTDRSRDLPAAERPWKEK